MILYMRDSFIKVDIKPDIFDIIAHCGALEYEGIHHKPDYKTYYDFNVKRNAFLVWIPHEECEEHRRYKIIMPNITDIRGYSLSAELISAGNHVGIQESIERGIADGSLLPLLNAHALL